MRITMLWNENAWYEVVGIFVGKGNRYWTWDENGPGINLTHHFRTCLTSSRLERVIFVKQEITSREGTTIFIRVLSKLHGVWIQWGESCNKKPETPRKNKSKKKLASLRLQKILDDFCFLFAILLVTKRWGVNRKVQHGWLHSFLLWCKFLIRKHLLK